MLAVFFFGFLTKANNEPIAKVKFIETNKTLKFLWSKKKKLSHLVFFIHQIRVNVYSEVFR